MADKVIWVSPDGPEWRVRWAGGPEITRRPTEAEAIAEARRTVRASPQGAVQQIIVLAPHGRIRSDWSCTFDRYPPV